MKFAKGLRIRDGTTGGHDTLHRTLVWL